MASTRIIEQDHGTYVGLVTHHHNGYYAGDFSRRGTVCASADAAPRAVRQTVSASPAPARRT
jgi:hypothetical protein